MADHSAMAEISPVPAV